MPNARPLALALTLAAAALLPGRAAAQETFVPTGAAATVQPGDQVVLRIVREPEMSGTFQVDETGHVVLPRLGIVRVADQGAGGLRDTLRLAFARYLRDPAIEVTVLRRIAVQGDVYKPGIYMVDLTTTLRDVVALAGGVTEMGNPSRIDILREGRRYRVSERDAAAVATAELRSGDRVVVGRRSWFARNPNAAIGTFTGLVGLFIGVVQLLRN
jgi:polysaccharide export outer membrane protein